MGKRVLEVGNCGVDHSALVRLVNRHFDAEVVPTADATEALAHLRKQPYDLVLVNRKLDVDYSDGMDVIRAIKADPDLSDVPVMLLSNYPESQAEAVAAGAEPGFGKLAYDEPTTVEKLSQFLS